MSEVAFSRKIECNESNDENSSKCLCERDYVTIITRYFEMSVRIRAFHFYAPQSHKTQKRRKIILLLNGKESNPSTPDRNASTSAASNASTAMMSLS